MISNAPKWTPEAVSAVDSLKATHRFREFIEDCCEFVARFAEEVTTEHVAMVLAWIASTEVKETGECQKH